LLLQASLGKPATCFSPSIPQIGSGPCMHHCSTFVSMIYIHIYIYEWSNMYHAMQLNASLLFIIISLGVRKQKKKKKMLPMVSSNPFSSINFVKKHAWRVCCRFVPEAPLEVLFFKSFLSIGSHWLVKVYKDHAVRYLLCGWKRKGAGRDKNFGWNHVVEGAGTSLCPHTNSSLNLRHRGNHHFSTSLSTWITTSK